MIQKVKETIKNCSLLKEGDTLLLAVSGGPDSVFMTQVFKKIQPELRLKIGLAYFHHSIREEAEQELEFVRKLALDCGFPFYWEKRDVPGIAKERRASLEETARVERYDFLIRTAKAYSYSKIAVAHNKDDQIETFLHRLLRGAGLKGLKGISPKLEVNGIQIIRPIMECWREEIESYLRKRRLTFCIDASNYETKFTRNKIRYRLLPYLIREYNPNLKEVLEATLENIGSAYDYIEEQLENEFKRCVKKNRSCVKIKIGRLKKIHPYLKSEIIRKAIEVVKGNLRRLEYRHFKEIESLLGQRPVGAIVNLPQGVWARKEKDWLVIERQVKDGEKR